MPVPVVELYYKSDELHDPMVNESHAQAFGWATKEQLTVMQQKALQVNQVLQPFFDSIGIILVDFKLEFGLADGKSCWETRYPLIPAASGTKKLWTSWTKTDSGETWDRRQKPTRKWSGGLRLRWGR